MSIPTPPKPGTRAPLAGPAKAASSTSAPAASNTPPPWEEKPASSLPTNHRTSAAANKATTAKAVASGSGFAIPAKRLDSGKKIVIYAVEKFGKTTLGCTAPESAIVMVDGETGYLTLHDADLVPSIPAVEARGWEDLLGVLRMVRDASQCDYKYLVIDALTGAERLCHQFVCKRDYGNDFSRKGFMSYNEGFQVALNDWNSMLAGLDQITQKGINVILLGHSIIKTHQNPTGQDFDRYICDIHAKTWSATKKWADAILFGNFQSIVKSDKPMDITGKGKGIGGYKRMLFCSHRDAWDAGNRFSLPDEIEICNDPLNAWNSIQKFIEKGE